MPKQLTGGPAWYDSERFDITAKPDQAGAPNVAQLRSMVRKLLADRFSSGRHKEAERTFGLYFDARERRAENGEGD